MTVIQGRRLYKQRVRYPDGSEAEELFAEEGDSANVAHSSVARMVRHCEAWGVSEEDWPIYAEVREGDVDLADVAVRCDRLRPALAKLGKCELDGVPWLGSVRERLQRGEQFVVCG